MSDKSNPYNNLVNLLAVYSEATGQLSKLENQMNELFLDLVDEHKKEYADLQKTLTDSEAAVKELAKLNPEWFAEAKTIKTPFGEVQSRRATSHSVGDVEATLKRIKAAQALALQQGDEILATQLGGLIRVEESVNLDACALIDETLLAQLGVERKGEESVTVKASKVSLGQAVKAATKREAKAAKGKAVAA